MSKKMGKLHLSQPEREVVELLLHQHVPHHEVWAFGSRVTGEHLKRFSDLDLVIRGGQPLDLDRLLMLKHDLIQSDLPFKVDVTDWHVLDESMKQRIASDYVVLKESLMDER